MLFQIVFFSDTEKLYIKRCEVITGIFLANKEAIENAKKDANYKGIDDLEIRLRETRYWEPDRKKNLHQISQGGGILWNPAASLPDMWDL